jgi:hypothetical protein
MVDIIIGSLVRGDDGDDIIELQEGNDTSSFRMHVEEFQSWARPRWEILERCKLTSNKEAVMLTDEITETLQSLGNDPLSFWIKTWTQKVAEKYGPTACIHMGW